MITAMDTARHNAQRRHRISPLPPNEAEAEADFSQAVMMFGAGSGQAEIARRHLHLIRRFNQVYGWSD